MVIYDHKCFIRLATEVAIPEEETHAYILNEIQLLLRDNVDPAAKVLQCGSGYRRRLMFKRIVSLNPSTPDTPWIIFHNHLC